MPYLGVSSFWFRGFLTNEPTTKFYARIGGSRKNPGITFVNICRIALNGALLNVAPLVAKFNDRPGCGRLRPDLIFRLGDR